MKTPNCLSKNLKAYQELRNLSLADFSREIDVPLSTLKSILKDGNTTLETVLRISQNLGISLDMLIYDSSIPDKLFILNHLEKSGSWFADIAPEKRVEIACHVLKIWEVMGND